ncbi:MAG: biosynthetic-type acetolactate synthase large subunit [Clostridiales bacterium]|nr:biosynthetic-type acetolactate synthase large subunit [Clostridiales bacterium]
MKINGAAAIVKCLLEQNATTVFGYPGGQILDLFDELYKEPKITQILTSHEQGAAHAAEGYARSTGKVGVVIATSGPGATNLVTGIADAYLDSVPLVAITGNVPVPLLGRDSFQEVDIAGITMPVTKHNFLVKDASTLPDVIRKAFAIARSDRPGPVLVDVPKNVQQALIEYEEKQVEPPHLPPVQADVSAAVKIIDESKKPLIYAGGGCVSSNASNELVKFAAKIKAPIAMSIMGLSAVSKTNEYYAGMIGMHGHASVARLTEECDIIIAIGARFSDRVAGNRAEFCKHAKIIHIDIDAAEIDKNVKTDAHVRGDVKQALEKLIALIKTKTDRTMLDLNDKYKREYTLPNCTGKLSPRTVIRYVSEHAGDAVVATDVGQHQMWVAQEYAFPAPRTFLTSGGLGTMGFGMGAAIGGAVGTNKRAILFTGDGSFHMNMNELATATRLNLPLTVIVFDNRTLGMVRQWQTLFYGKRYSSTNLGENKTDFVKLAEAFGAKGYRIDDDKDVPSVIGAALSERGVTVIDCVMDSDEFVLPMIPPGKTVKDIITDLKDCKPKERK